VRARPPNVIDLLGGYAATNLIREMLARRVVDSLHEWRTVAEISRLHRIDHDGALVLLNFLYCCSDFLQRRGERFRLAPRYSEHHAWRGVFEKFTGAYGQMIAKPLSAHRSGADAGIDRSALARAYSWDSESPVVIKTIEDLRPDGVLDIGCGRATLLAEICARIPAEGWGIDPSGAMCRAARGSVASAGLQSRIVIRRGSALTINQVLSLQERRRISLIYAGSLMNEFARSDATLVALLDRLSRWFPGCWLIVVDYLGALTGRRKRAGNYTYLNDIVQVLSGQGVPPASHEKWSSIYRAAGAQLSDIIEGRTLDLRWFVHVVRLRGYRHSAKLRSTSTGK
jgi:SAM-dependent methyltransferase